MKISIITATYNSQDTILDTILSAASQTYSDIEHIIIDGKSTDNTLSIINDNSEKISKIISESDEGIYDALNKGIKNATGDVICFLHADDIYTDHTIIEKAAKLFSEKQTDSIYGDLQYVAKGDTSKIIRYWKSGEFSFSKLKKAWMPPHPTFFVKKEVYDKFGLFDTSFRIAADYDIILRFLGKHKISTAYLPEVLIKMRVGGESNKSIKHIFKKMKEDVKALKKNKLGNWHTVLLKNIIKIPQLFKK
ncbi:MAG: glycosyltransferase [Bacteroidales bacterium]|nr:glycosyltransferase [Bacteroidales bacterium]